MSMTMARLVWALWFLAAFALSPAARAQDGAWRVAKVSGEAWIGGSGVQPTSASASPQLHPGETVRTGRNGRVLLVRGAESILVSPNSSISLPKNGRTGQTTIIQQAGSILLDVEKRNVPHFEVETPYLAAVVKGTRFRVSLNGGKAKVDVVRGQVQVADFRSGQFALVSPGQSARASFGANVGLSLSGSGALAPIQSGQPQAPRVAPIPIPSRGLGAAPGSQKLQPVGATLRPDSQNNSAGKVDAGQKVIAPGVVGRPGGAIRISAPIGEIKLDISAVTRGIARSATPASGQSVRQPTVWGTGELNPGISSGTAAVVNSGSASGTAEINSGAGAISNAGGIDRGINGTSPVGGHVAAQGNGGGIGKGNAGNGNGNGGGKGLADGGGPGKGNGPGGNNGNGNGPGGNNGNGNGPGGNNGNGNGKGGQGR